MRNIQSEVLRDMMYCALRQVLRDCEFTIDTLRKSYDVVYYQVGGTYGTFSLNKEDDLYVVCHTTQLYNGDITNAYSYKLHADEPYLTDLMNCLDFIVTTMY